MSLINNFSKQHFGLSLVLYIREQSTFKNLVQIICAGEPSYRNYISALKCFLQWVKKLNNNDKNNNNQKNNKQWQQQKIKQFPLKSMADFISNLEN